jgi:hypothetical protein
LNEVAAATAPYAVPDESAPPQLRTYESPFSNTVWPSLSGHEYASAVSVGPAEVGAVAEYGVCTVETPVGVWKDSVGNPKLPDNPMLMSGMLDAAEPPAGVVGEPGSPRLPDMPMLRNGVAAGLPPV